MGTDEDNEAGDQADPIARLRGAGRESECVESIPEITQAKAAEERIARHAAVLEGINRIFREDLSGHTENEDEISSAMLCPRPSHAKRPVRHGRGVAKHRVRSSDGAAPEPCVRGLGFKHELPDCGKMLMRV
jgi:hypothetical protein